MNTKTIPDQIWKDVLHDKVRFEFESLSLKILLSNLKLKLKTNPTNEALFINEIKKMLHSQEELPSLQRDLQKIYERGGIL